MGSSLVSEETLEAEYVNKTDFNLTQKTLKNLIIKNQALESKLKRNVRGYFQTSLGGKVGIHDSRKFSGYYPSLHFPLKYQWSQGTLSNPLRKLIKLIHHVS